MADTIVTNSPGASDNSGLTGLVIALIILVVIALGGVILYQRGLFHAAPQPTPSSSTNVNVTVPTPTTGSGGSTSY